MGSSNNTKTEPCACGYNADGKAYCPVDSSTRSNNVMALISNFNTAASGKCNTYNRFDCKRESEDVRAFGNAVKNQHIFYKSVSCASEVLSRQFINFSLITLMLFALLY